MRASRLTAAIVLLALALCQSVDAARQLKAKSRRWYPCAYGKSKNYMRCCQKKWWRGYWDPSCPYRARTCAAVPYKYYSYCCKGKKASGVYDAACKPKPVGSACGSRGPNAIDQCCANKNPWTDSTCKAWTSGTCRGVIPALQSLCCAQKSYGQDRWCDQQRYGNSCASWGSAKDACCASTNPWNDKSCSAWLPWGNCGSVSDTYKLACCANKPLGKQGCPAPPGSTCGSQGPANIDACCSSLADPSADSSCRAWTNRGQCSDVVDSSYYDACCWGKLWGVDPSCNRVLGTSAPDTTPAADPSGDAAPGTVEPEEVTVDVPPGADSLPDGIAVPDTDDIVPAPDSGSDSTPADDPTVDPTPADDPDEPKPDAKPASDKGGKAVPADEPADEPEPEPEPEPAKPDPTKPFGTCKEIKRCDTYNTDKSCTCAECATGYQPDPEDQKSCIKVEEPATYNETANNGFDNVDAAATRVDEPTFEDSSSEEPSFEDDF